MTSLIIADGNLYCNYCNCNVNWIHKSDVLRHTQAAKHAKARQRALANASISVSRNLGDDPDVSYSNPGDGSSTQTVILSTSGSRTSETGEGCKFLPKFLNDLF